MNDKRKLIDKAVKASNIVGNQICEITHNAGEQMVIAAVVLAGMAKVNDISFEQLTEVLKEVYQMVGAVGVKDD